MSVSGVDVHLTDADLDRALRADVADGLTSSPKTLPPKWFYDHAGSELFDEITRLEPYYPTRCERQILHREAPAIAEFGARTLVELGSGSSDKTRVLLDAMSPTGLTHYVPFDVSETFLRSAAHDVAVEYPQLDVHAVVGDFEHHLDQIPHTGTRVVALLGGTIGNLDPLERKRFYTDLRASLEPGDALLLGTDLVKEVDRLERAYDDPEGVTAAFNRNVLSVINRELDADFPVQDFEHRSVWSAENEWIEMRLRARRAHTVRIGELDLVIEFVAGEEVRTEISSKFRRDRVAEELGAGGFELREWWTDENDDYALSLSEAR